MNKVINNNIVFLLVFINTFLYNYLETTINLSFLDEFSILIIIFLAIIFSMLKGLIKFNGYEKKILILFGLVIFIGLISNYYSQYQEPVAIFNDAIVFSKPLATYFSSRIAFNNVNILSIYKNFKIPFIIILIFLSGFTLLNFIFTFFEPYEIRFGIPAQSLFFGHPSKYAFAFALIFLFLFPSTSKTILYLTLLFGCFSFRAKYVGFSIIATLCISYSKILKIHINFSKSLFVGVFLIIILYLFFSDQIAYYYSEEAFVKKYARAVLNIISLQIANDFFPLGSGFSTFASYYSGIYYSPLYSLYGIADVWGLGGGNNFKFISDTFWPMVISQFGYIGCIIYIIIFVLFLKMYINFFNTTENIKTKKVFLSAILILMYMLIDSSADSTITQNKGVVCFLLLGLITNLREVFKK